MLKKLRAQLRKPKTLIILIAILIAANVIKGVTDRHLRPSTVAEFARTSVMITNLAQNSGGSGVILSSSPQGSIILTNKHVCGVVVYGGWVIREGSKALVVGYRASNEHDLCQIKINEDLHVNTKVADNAPEKYSTAYISGHPALLPHVLTTGSFSGRLIIPVMMGQTDCISKIIKDPFGDRYEVQKCKPIMKAYDAQLVTGTILPGSSGSGVFDKNGEIAALVFAGNGGGLGYAFVVPHQYVKRFVTKEADTLAWQSPVKEEDAEAEKSGASESVYMVRPLRPDKLTE